MKKILVYLNTDLERVDALERAVRLAKAGGGSIKIVDIVEELPTYLQLPTFGYPALKDSLREEKTAKLEKLAEPFRDKDLAIETAVLEGKPFVEICREVVRNQHDLVVKAAEGGGVAKIFGSTGVRLLQQCPCPVWLLKPGRRRKTTRVLAAVDPLAESEAGPELNARILSLASRLAEIYGGELHVIHVWSGFGGGRPPGRSQLSEKQARKLRQFTRKLARESLDALLETHADLTRGAATHLVEGDAGREIKKFAERRRIDTVVIGTVVRSGLAGVVIGNTAERVVGRLNCSLLAVKPAGFESGIRVEN